MVAIAKDKSPEVLSRVKPNGEMEHSVYYHSVKPAGASIRKEQIEAMCVKAGMSFKKVAWGEEKIFYICDGSFNAYWRAWFDKNGIIYVTGKGFYHVGVNQRESHVVDIYLTAGYLF